MDNLKPCPFCGGKAKTHACAELCNEEALIGKPVEVTIEHNTFKDFRILTEVL